MFFRAQELIAHGKNSVNLSTATTSRVKEQAIVTANLIKERVRRDKLDELEKLHQQESSGERNERIGQEHQQQEQEQTSDSDSDFLENSDLPREIAEPSVEITETENLQEIPGENEPSLSLLPLQELEGTAEVYPISAEFGPLTEPENNNLLLTDDFLI